MENIIAATFILTVLVSMSSVLVAILVSLPMVGKLDVQASYVEQLETILTPYTRITTADGIRALRERLPLPTSKRTFSNRTGLRAAAPSATSELATQVDAPKPELLAAMQDMDARIELPTLGTANLTAAGARKPAKRNSAPAARIPAWLSDDVNPANDNSAEVYVDGLPLTMVRVQRTRSYAHALVMTYAQGRSSKSAA